MANPEKSRCLRFSTCVAYALLIVYATVVCGAPAHADPEAALTIKGHTIRVEVADTKTAREQGLMFRKKLGANHGMLFVFPKPEIIAMWMVNTDIPLSVAFVDEKGIIINIENMMPLTEELHEANASARFALEMNAGWFKKNRVGAGDKIIGLSALAPAEQ